MVDLIFFDFAKAFDLVDHVILINKLQNLGINGAILGWIKSFLSDKSLRVRIFDSLSMPKRVTSGVPQGTVLGPLLFIIYINHLVSGLTCNCKIFADDLKIYLSFPCNNETDLQTSLLQTNIDHLVQTSSSWGLRLNHNKCAVMRFGSGRVFVREGTSPYKIEGVFIDFVSSYTDLGVTVQNDLKFHSHIHAKAGRVGNLMTNLLSSTLNRCPDFMCNIYVSHIRPLIDYASSLWNMGYIGDMKLLEGLQRRWTRSIDGMSGMTYGERLRKLDLFSLQGRLLRADLILVWKMFNGKCAIPVNNLFSLSTNTATRGHSMKLVVPKSRLDLRHKFFSVRIVNQWNALSSETVEADSLNKFKRLLLLDLGDELYEYNE